MVIIEEEIKIKPFANKEGLVKFLNKLHAKKLYDVIEVDYYYQHPCRDFALTDEALRIRVVQGKSFSKYILTYKGPRLSKEGVKKREEIELSIEDPGKVDRLLSKLGFKKVATITKKRSYYRIQKCLVSIDEVKELGLFMEIECSSNEIKTILSKMDIRYIIEDRTYLEMILEKMTK
ncbi:MAG: class IV adenylate cyclase [Desulfurococcales archaeon]|nr:class IV adenylate cyclase [Desulfurococcales archaeon]